MNKTYGYARVSTREQNLDRQIDALREYGVAERDIVSDKASGKDIPKGEDATGRRYLGYKVSRSA